jgi:hypothetical protein
MMALVTARFCGALCMFLFALWQMKCRDEPHPFKRSGEWLRQNGTRLLITLVAVQVSSAAAAAFSALKAALPALIPYWSDSYLAAFEGRLFGMQSWELSHLLFGWATPAIDLIYFSWIFVQVAVFYAVLVSKPSPLKTRALVSYSLGWMILGLGAAYTLSSAGPIFHDRMFGGDTFAGLEAALRDAPATMRAADKLWQVHRMGGNGVGAGISAMPSLHVAIALWIALIARHSRLGLAGWIYFGLICLGSVHLGWHYASDSLIGAVGFYLIWSVSGRPFQVRDPAASGVLAAEARA